MEYGAYTIFSAWTAVEFNCLSITPFFQLNRCILVIVCFYVRAYLGNLAWMGNCFLYWQLGKANSMYQCCVFTMYILTYPHYYVHCSSTMSERWGVGQADLFFHFRPVAALTALQLALYKIHFKLCSGFLVHELLEWKLFYLAQSILVS